MKKIVRFIFSSTALIGFLALSLGFYFYSATIETNYPSFYAFLIAFSSIFFKVFLAIALFAIFYIAHFLVIKRLSLTIMRSISDNEDTINAFRKIILFFWWVIYIFLLLALIAGGFSQLVTFFGLIGLGLSLVFQKPLLNIVGWFTLTSNNLYKEGDRLEVHPIRGEIIRGDVIEIGLLHTSLRSLYKGTETRDFKTVIFPNEFVLISQIRNYTKDSNYIVDELKIRIDLESDYERAREIFKEVIQENMKKNLRLYIKRIKKEQVDVESSLTSLLRKSKRKTTDKEKKEEIKVQSSEMSEKSQELEEELKKIKEIGDAFKARVYVNVQDTFITLVGVYIVPYVKVRPTRNLITLAFLKKIKRFKKIKIAKLSYSVNDQ